MANNNNEPRAPVAGGCNKLGALLASVLWYSAVSALPTAQNNIPWRLLYPQTNILSLLEHQSWRAIISYLAGIVPSRGNDKLLEGWQR